MLTAERAQELEKTLRHFPLLEGWEAPALLGLIERELSHAEILDGFRPYGKRKAHAIPLQPILHIVSHNTPHAALQSLVRGLLLGSHNFLKIPTAGLPEAEEFIRLLSPSLASLVHVSRSLEDSWLEKAEAVIVFGADETIETLRKKVSADCLFLPHGHSISFGIVFEDPHYSSVEAAAKDVFLYDQRGCLSPHTLYVASSLASREYARRLANALKKLCDAGCEAHSTAEAAGIFAERHYFHFLQTMRPDIEVWASEGSSDWTVIHDPNPEFRPSPLGRTVFVKPLPTELSVSLAGIHKWISGIGIWPAREEYAQIAAQLGASRICPLGKMQFPPADWHQDALPVLSQLVHWVDFEEETQG